MTFSPHLQFTRDGKYLVAVDRTGLSILDAQGQSRELGMVGVREVAVFGDQVWTVAEGVLARWTLDGRSLGAPAACEQDGHLIPSLIGAAAATWSGTPTRLWVDDLGTFKTIDAEACDAIVPLTGRRYLALDRVRGMARLRVGTASWTMPAAVHVVTGAALFDGAKLVLIVERNAMREAWIATTAGGLGHRIELPAGPLRIAARRGLAIVQTEPTRFEVIDLRFGRRVGGGSSPEAIEDLAIDGDGGLVGIRSERGVALVLLREAMRRASIAVIDPPALEAAVADPAGAGSSSPGGTAAEPAPAFEPAAAATEPASVTEPALATEPAEAAIEPVSTEVTEVKDTLVGPFRLDALRPRPAAAAIPVAEALSQLDDEMRLVGLWTLVAIAVGWDTRRLGYANESVHPHEHEVAALLGMNQGFATEHVTAARAAHAAHAARLAADPGRRAANTPLGALAAELELSPLAIDILLVVAAPTLWGEAARLYGILSNDAARAVADELLVHQVLGAGRASRHELARELDPRGPLIQSGAIQIVGHRPRPFTELTVDPVVIARLRGEAPDLGPAVAVRDAAPSLGALELPRSVLLGALVALEDARPPAARIVVRGRPGTGRRTLLASLATRVGRPLGVLDVTLLPRAPEVFTAALRLVLRRLHLAGTLPCVTRLDQLSFGELSVADVVSDVLRAHLGPLALVLPSEATPPLDPGYVAIELPVPGETERLALWQRVLAAHDLWVPNPAGLAARYRIGPGVIHRAVAAVVADKLDGDVTGVIDGFVRQTRDARLGAVARRVERMATWSSLVLPPDILDSLRELIGRVRHRRQVYEQWGMSAAMTTSRGITALFQGPPGTGKSLVAGVIARELGLDLYQIDLSKVMSKWIGETERNLSTIFDAAEDGQVILLFDEADSLFAKRTEVRSSNDRYANLEVNYLLQRLDAFEGIAILTTNFGGSIDPAFKRRLSFRLSFPFPDEDTREQLWRVHLPPQLPIGGELALDKLARKYQLAGGYIRNACLRAAFLAAQEECALVQEHLERAVALEFAELGKLSSSGAIE